MRVSAVEARKAEGGRRMLQVRNRHLFAIVVGEEETFAKFLLDSGGEGTERGGAEGCVTVLFRRKAQERVALWRDTYASSLESSKLSPFFFFQKWYVMKDTPTTRASVCVWASTVEARKAEGVRRVIRVRDRHLVDIVVGELETLGFFFFSKKKKDVVKDTTTRRVSPLYTRARKRRVAAGRFA